MNRADKLKHISFLCGISSSLILPFNKCFLTYCINKFYTTASQLLDSVSDTCAICLEDFMIHPNANSSLVSSCFWWSEEYCVQ